MPRRGFGRIAGAVRQNALNSPLLWRAQRDVIRGNDRPPDLAMEGAIRELPDARDDRFHSKYRPKGRAGARLFDTARAIQSRRSRTVSLRYVVAVFRPAAPGRPG